MIYLDSSAVVKLVRREAGTTELVAWLGGQPGVPLVSSVLAEVEVVRALRRHDRAALPAAAGVLARLTRVEMDAPIRALAAGYEDDLLRSLDAIHLATAESLEATGELRAFIAYDQRLNAAARSAGLPVTDPAGPTQS